MVSQRLFGEYAIDPRVVRRWATPDLPMEFVEGVGFGSGRFVAAVPSKSAWREAAKAVVDSMAGLHRERATELFAQMKERMSTRCTSGVAKGDWLTLTAEEHGRHPFEGVVPDRDTAGPPGALPSAIGALSRDEGWLLVRGATICGRAEAIGRLLAPLLRTGKQIIIIDPHLGPAPRFLGVVEALLRAAWNGRCCGPPQRIEIHTSSKTGQEPARFAEAMAPPLRKVTPCGWSVRVVRWQAEGLDRADLHDRFVMTNLGGVAFLRGLDATSGKTRLDVMDRDRLFEVWHDYAGARPRFQRFQPDLVVEGARRFAGAGVPERPAPGATC